MDFCGQCRSCRWGLPTSARPSAPTWASRTTAATVHTSWSTKTSSSPSPPDVSLTEATMLLDVMGTGGHAIARAQLVRPDIESLLVTGAGPIGLGVLAMAKLLLGTGPPRLRHRLGPLPSYPGRAAGRPPLSARRVHRRPWTPPLTPAARRRHGGRRVDALNQRGVLVCVGHGQGLTLDVSAGPDRHRTGRPRQRIFLLCRTAGQSGSPAGAPGLSVLQIITHRYGVGELQTAFETFFGGETGKVIIRAMSGEQDQSGADRRGRLGLPARPRVLGAARRRLLRGRGPDGGEDAGAGG